MKPALLFFVVLTITLNYAAGVYPGICKNSKLTSQLHKSLQSPAPYDVIMSANQVTSLQDTIAVIVKTRKDGPNSKRFLVLATNEADELVGSWTNTTWSHSLSCSAVTLVIPAEKKQEVTLVWKPLASVPSGKIRIKVLGLQGFSTIWPEVPVVESGPEISSRKGIATQLSSHIKKRAVPLQEEPVTQRGFIDRFFGGETTSTTTKKTTPKPTTTVAPTTKRRSIINRVFGGGTTSPPPTTKTTTRLGTTLTTTTKQGFLNRLFGSDTTTTKTTTPKPTTTTPKPTTTKRRSIINRVFGGGTTTPAPTTTKTTKATTTVTTTKPGILNRLFGGGSTTPSTPKPTPKPTTTTTVSTTTKRRSLINRVFGSDTTTTTTTTKKPTTTTTTQKPGLFSGLFGGN